MGLQRHGMWVHAHFQSVAAPAAGVEGSSQEALPVLHFV
jgi:hypothetical protein